jgi:N-acetylneuraminic acid mutarotase
MSVTHPALKNGPASALSLSAIIALSVCLLLTACGGGGGSTTPPPPPPATYSIGGTLTGLASGNSITLSDNGGDNLTVTGNGPFTFATHLQSGTAYSLTLAATTPTVQPCTSTFGSGTVNGANVTNLNVFCGLPGGPGTYTVTGSMASARNYHTTTLLGDGTVLAAGGVSTGLSYIASCELYSPSTGSWTGTGAMTQARAYQTATLLPDGNVLVSGGTYVGGGSGGALSSSELYNPSTRSWTTTGSLNTARWGHTATLLPNGQVLVVGGVGSGVGASGDLSSAELYDPSTGIWTATGSLSTTLAFHTATLLPNGKVLVAGGDHPVSTSNGGGSVSLDSAEIYDPSTGTWTATGSLVTAREFHTATLLPNGQVLVAGGVNYPTLVTLDSAELYDPSTGSWTSTGSLATGRLLHTATLLPSGNVLVSGGSNAAGELASSELFNPETGNWSPTGSLVQARSQHDAALLTNGKVLVTGGIDSPSTVLASSELYF